MSTGEAALVQHTITVLVRVVCRVRDTESTQQQRPHRRQALARSLQPQLATTQQTASHTASKHQRTPAWTALPPLASQAEAQMALPATVDTCPSNPATEATAGRHANQTTNKQTHTHTTHTTHQDTCGGISGNPASPRGRASYHNGSGPKHAHESGACCQEWMRAVAPKPKTFVSSTAFEKLWLLAWLADGLAARAGVVTTALYTTVRAQTNHRAWFPFTVARTLETQNPAVWRIRGTCCCVSLLSKIHRFVF